MALSYASKIVSVWSPFVTMYSAAEHAHGRIDDKAGVLQFEGSAASVMMPPSFFP